MDAMSKSKPQTQRTAERLSRCEAVGDASSIAGWYNGIVPTARHPMARLVCQRMNLQYDASLRKKYGTYLIWSAGIVFIALICGAVAKNLRLLDFAAVAATVSPAIFWAIREQFRQSDSNATNKVLKGDTEKYMESVRTDGCDDAECEKRSRELQDALFQRRVANPLVLPLVYPCPPGICPRCTLLCVLVAPIACSRA